MMNILYSEVFDITIIKLNDKKFNLNKINSFKTYLNELDNKNEIINELKVYNKYNRNKTIERLLKDI